MKVDLQEIKDYYTIIFKVERKRFLFFEKVTIYHLAFPEFIKNALDFSMFGLGLSAFADLLGSEIKLLKTEMYYLFKRRIYMKSEEKDIESFLKDAYKI